MKLQASPDSRFLSIDIGGSNIKATILNFKGELLMDYEKIVTPAPANPENVVKVIKTLIKNFPPFDFVSVGFPGYVRDGVVLSAPNLGYDFWDCIDLSQMLTESLGKPATVVNDADMQGLGVASGKGLEMVVTLGTGFGTALLNEGILLPHFEISHHPLAKGGDYDQYIGDKALVKEGVVKWNKRMKKVLKVLKTVFNYDHLYIGGGNASKLNFRLDKNITLVTNRDGIKGGSRLWQVQARHDLITSVPASSN
jgi:polyphosphate glucokinase